MIPSLFIVEVKPGRSLLPPIQATKHMAPLRSTAPIPSPQSFWNISQDGYGAVSPQRQSSVSVTRNITGRDIRMFLTRRRTNWLLNIPLWGMDGNIGNLLTTEGNDETTREILVLSAILMQGRSEARRRAVYPRFFCLANHLGVGCVRFSRVRRLHRYQCWGSRN